MEIYHGVATTCKEPIGMRKLKLHTDVWFSDKKTKKNKTEVKC